MNDIAEVSIPSLTDTYAAHWAMCGMASKWQIKRLTEWANMLEKRVAELDPNYRAYQFGRTML